jgi:hydroxymethylbilane synthase
VNSIRIGTRGSALARAQANWVKQQLEQVDGQCKVDLVTIKTKGDRFFETPIHAIGGKGIFVKEIEDALLSGAIDLAVHSMKDLPTKLPPGLIIAAIPPREDPRDVLVSRNRLALKALPQGAKVGTGSLRRRAQILHYRSDLSVLAIRGNIDTRLKKLAAREFDALILAAAGLKRIGREQEITEFLPPAICVSAVGQGALGLEAREDAAVRKIVARLHHPPTSSEIVAERSFLDRLGGGCHVPVGARAIATGEMLEIVGVVGDPDGRALCHGELSGLVAKAAVLGRELAERLLAQGAATILGAAPVA